MVRQNCKMQKIKNKPRAAAKPPNRLKGAATMTSKLIGKKVTITAGFHTGDWGTVIDVDGEFYHVAMFDDLNDAPIFSRNEFKVTRKGA